MKETLRRAGRTFLQAAIGYLATNIGVALAGADDFEIIKSTLLCLCVSSIAAGLAALMNLPPKNDEIEEENEEDER